MASAWSVSLNGVWWRSPGGGAPSGVQGQSPLWGSGGEGREAPLKLKAFCTFLYKKWPKVKDLCEICVKICPVFDSRCHDQS